MPKKRITNQEVFENGTVIDHYVCDMNLYGDYEANGSIEYIVMYNNVRYYIHTDWDHMLLNPFEKAIVDMDQVV